uniref:Uncharacterized protein n=1 Tax=Vespula pensylvanica TaxID=30213 RepID=A0A834NZJ8_VESPE|nr:hypothetical protein H0235_009885 [Vespula pensylvanica]
MSGMDSVKNIHWHGTPSRRFVEPVASYTIDHTKWNERDRGKGDRRKRRRKRSCTSVDLKTGSARVRAPWIGIAGNLLRESFLEILEKLGLSQALRVSWVLP